MLHEKITQIKKQVYHYIYNKNVDIYIKIQTLFEFLIKDYLIQKEIFTSELDENSIYFLLNEYISDNYYDKYNVLNLFGKINRKANAGLKHYNEMIVDYDEELVKDTIVAFNNLNKYLNGDRYNKYNINEEIFEKNKFNIKNTTNNNYNKNLIIEKKDKKNITKSIKINTGVSNVDYGFEIFNIKLDNITKFKYSNIYAVLFNLLQRSTKLEKDSVINEFENKNKIQVDYKKVYRLELIILLLIKNNYFNEKYELKIQSKENYNYELECAIYHIKDFYNKILSIMKINYDGIDIEIDSNQGIMISLENDMHSIYVVDNIDRKSNDRYIWYENNIKYQIINNDRELLKSFLNDFFGYKEFKLGQFEALQKILNSDNNEVIIMPTGSGKSLIFYFAALLQPSPSLVISPTEILIKDQIRNLYENHSFNDVKPYYLYDKNKKIELNNKLIYLTPAILQQRESILSFIDYNVNCKIANIFLDEIHTISNWSHNFRPDYLMMAFNLKTFIDNPRYIGFTATANYRVVKDISNQLNIPFNEIYTPIELKKENIEYNFILCKDEEEFIKFFNKTAENIISNDYQKMITFTKNNITNEFIKKNIDEKFKYDIDIFSESDEHSYDGFLNGRRCILLAENDVGIGINIPNINIIFHYGIPISKAKFVQEIGRAGRDGTRAISVVTYKDKKSMTNDELRLLDFNTDIDTILDIISDSNNDIALALQNIVGHLEHYSIMASRIKSIYNYIKESKTGNMVISIDLHKKNNKNQTEICLYFLVKMGVLYNWYIRKITDDKIYYDIEINDDISLESIKTKSINYICTFGNSKETIYNIENSSYIEEIIYQVQSWYYNQFLLYHREQLINMLDFLENSRINNYTKTEIANELSNYFSIASTNVNEDILEYLNKIKSQQIINYKISEKNNKKEISNDENIENVEIDKYKNGYTLDINNKFHKTLIYILREDDAKIKNLQMEKYLETEYDLMADIYIYLYNLFIENNSNNSRYERILNNLDINEKYKFLRFSKIIYKQINDMEIKFELINILFKYFDKEEVLNRIYEDNKDLIYYGIALKKVNDSMRGVLYE